MNKLIAMLDDKITYARTYRKYKKMPLAQLERELGTLFHRRNVEHDLECYELYRIASAAYHRRTRSGTGLIFHMKNLVSTKRN